MPVKQYPYYLFRQVQSTASTQDENGNWVAAAPTWVLHSSCREETNGKGAQINGQDGKAIVFSSTIYAPKGTAKIPEGTLILVSETNSSSGVKRICGTCLKCDPGQMNVRLWV